MIISASRRTDIPAFFGEWLLQRVEEGSCRVANPFRPSQISVVSLLPKDVDCFVFWTRHAATLLPRLDELNDRGYSWYFLYTVVDYPEPYQRPSPDLETRIDLLKKVLEAGKSGSIIWRYDPILLSSRKSVSFHLDTFEKIAESLDGYVDRVIISFLDLYAKVKRRLADLEEDAVIAPNPAELVPPLVELAAAHGMTLQACAEKLDLTPYGVSNEACINGSQIQRATGVPYTGTIDRAQRDRCLCLKSRDIGTYNTCRYGCLYCYATDSGVRATLPMIEGKYCQ